MPDLTSLLLVFFLAVVCLKWLLDKRGLPYPPGPKPLPIIGNARDIPKVKPWITYTNWREQYGDLIHMSAMGQHLVIINSTEVAVDLLEKRSHNYCDRPSIPMVDLVGWMNSAFLRYGDLWKKHRQLFHQKFRHSAIPAFQPLELRQAHELLRNLLDSPEEFVMHARNLPASVIVYIVYGHEIAPQGDEIVTLQDEATTMIADVMFLGSQLVNVFPILRHIPGWMPGAGFKRTAQKCREKIDQMQDVPFDVVKQRMAAGTAVPSWTSDTLEKIDAAGGDKGQEEIIKVAAATCFAAATDTTASSLKTFILAMTLYPDVQAKAQAEIDSVIGNKRLPTFDDRSSLPYVEALCLEVLRWCPPLPLAAPHATIEDDTYNGHFIPRGATVMTNLWAMCHDERVYNSPDQFIPERFLAADGSVLDTTVPSFGFGRRICAGRAQGAATLWIGVVSMLSVFNFKKAKDEAGREIDIIPAFSDGGITHPLPFQCSITPRSHEAQELISATSLADGSHTT